MSKRVGEVYDVLDVNERYIQVSSETLNLKVDKHSYWCDEDQRVETLRKNAETALKDYAEALMDVYLDERTQLDRLVRKAKQETRMTNFLKKLFKKAD